jgi:YD repeat-containing protein
MLRIMKNGVVNVSLVLMGMLGGFSAFSQSKPAGSTVTISYSYDRNGRLVTADYGSSGRMAYVYDTAGNLIHMEVVTALTRAMSVNFTSGGVGSFFTIRGSGFSPGSQLLILVNNIPLSPLVLCDGSGNFVLVLSSAGASVGVYHVSAMQMSGSAGREAAAAYTAIFQITTGGPVRARESSTDTAPSIALPANSALPASSLLYLPVILRN